MGSEIKRIFGREILDSRGNPTVEVDVYLDDGSFGRASVPSGASTGSHEAVELRDGDNKRYGGKGVGRAIANVNGVVQNAILGKNFDQKLLDETLISLDGTKNKSIIGANAILGVSLAFAKAKAFSENKPFWVYIKDVSGTNTTAVPVPMLNILNGGKHASGGADIQEFMIVPAGVKSYKEELRVGAEVFHCLKKILEENGLDALVGDEGGFAPSLTKNEDALELIMSAITRAGYAPGSEIFLAIDSAASELYKNEKYYFKSEEREFSGELLIKLYENWVEKYPIISIEDGLDEDDWYNFKIFTDKLGSKINIVGDDLFVTNIERLKRGIQEKCGNTILIKPNQIGTLTETIDATILAKQSGYKTIMSHRSGETEDVSVSHLAVGLSTDYVKFGSLSRSERLAKYNELLRIEENLSN